MVCSPKSAGNFSRMARWMASIPVPSLALMMMGAVRNLLLSVLPALSYWGRTSALFQKQYDRDPSFFQSLKPFLFLCVSGFTKQQGDVGFSDYFQGAFYAHFSQLAFVIEARSVNKQTRAEWMNFHCFCHRISSSAGSGGDYNGILPCQGIDKAGLSAVPSSKDGNVQAVGTRCIIHKSEI